MIKVIMNPEGVLDCIPDDVSVTIYNNATQYLMWETPEYRKLMLGGGSQ